MLPPGGRRRLPRLMEGKLCCGSRCARQQLPSFGAMEKLHFKDISNQKPGSKVISQLFSVHHIQLLVTKDRLGSFFIKG